MCQNSVTMSSKMFQIGYFSTIAAIIGASSSIAAATLGRALTWLSQAATLGQRAASSASDT